MRPVLWAVAALLSLPPALQANTPDKVGFSGMAGFDAHHYLVVQDAKSHQKTPRLVLLNKRKNKAAKMKTVAIDWPVRPARDLESACLLPNSDNEFLVAESGDWEDKKGRLFHIKLQKKTLSAKVLHSHALPFYKANNRKQQGDNYEGMACIATDKGLLILLAERGGSAAYPAAIIRTTFYQPGTQMQWSEVDTAVTAPRDMGKSMRHISDLYADNQLRLWAVAAMDESDDGPFASMVYQLGKIDKKTAKLTINPTPSSLRMINGFKVEALSRAPQGYASNIFSIGTEDEVYDGQWRLIKLQ